VLTARPRAAPRDLPTLLSACDSAGVPAIVTYRAGFEEPGRYEGPEGPRLAALARAVELGAAYVDVELKAAGELLPILPAGRTTKLIVSSHRYDATPPLGELMEVHAAAAGAGADVVKVATMAGGIEDVGTVARLVEEGSKVLPTVGLVMGEAGQTSRLLAPKLGGFLTFGALRPEFASAPGQPTLAQLRSVYRLPAMTDKTRVLGVVGNPVAHSKSPALHNAALAAAGADYTYVPCLVEDLGSFLGTEPFSNPDYAGFSVTIPHKEAALEACEELDPLAAEIGAVNTMVRLPSGGFKGYNTDSVAAIDACEAGAGGPGSLEGCTFVVVGAGGAGRALAFGAKARGAARVVVANRNVERAAALAAAVGECAEAVSLEELGAGRALGDVLANTTAVGMEPNDGETPVPAAALEGYKCVFDAVYAPLETRLLREAAAAGATPVSGLEMFVGQAAEQFRLFTGIEPDTGLMRQAVLDAAAAEAAH